MLLLIAIMSRRARSITSLPPWMATSTRTQGLDAGQLYEVTANTLVKKEVSYDFFVMAFGLSLPPRTRVNRREGRATCSSSRLEFAKTTTDEIVREVLFPRVPTSSSIPRTRIAQSRWKNNLPSLISQWGAKDRKSHLHRRRHGHGDRGATRFHRHKNKIAVDMTLTSDFPDGDDVILTIDLFPNGRYYIDGEKDGAESLPATTQCLAFRERSECAHVSPIDQFICPRVRRRG